LLRNAQSCVPQRLKQAKLAFKAGFASTQSACVPLKLNATGGSFKRWLASFEHEACRTLKNGRDITRFQWDKGIMVLKQF